MSHHNSNIITGTLVFSLKKILLKIGDDFYYVRLPRSQREYLHGDRVRARITKKKNISQLAEVEILGLLTRTTEQLLGRIVSRNNKKYISILRDFGYYETSLTPTKERINDGDIFLVKFTYEGTLLLGKKFADDKDFDIEEKILIFTAGLRIDFSRFIEQEAEKYSIEQGEIIKNTLKKRRDFRDECVWTIDGADAKDLDDAISIKMDAIGRYILGVHIADVAEYVHEGSALDKEALLRATSIYTPNKVIPMLPKGLSNDVCSLHPGKPKLVVSCIMTVNQQGMVEHTELTEGIIESIHRGVYEEIQKNHEGDRNNYYGNMEELGTNPNDNLENDQSSPLQDKKLQQTLPEAIKLSYELYEILKKRRKKEGKILFETTETMYEFDAGIPGVLTPNYVHTRSRVDAHMLIEEFMVLANEEVAKWCNKHDIPFLSRVHGLPPYNSVEIIKKIIVKGGVSKSYNSNELGVCSNNKKTKIDAFYNEGNKNIDNPKSKPLEPRHIREFLDALPPDDLYKYSRLLLPKMAKATYTDTKHRHFGLALEYYSHFTSPIRRYPDLQVHRIIKEKLRGTLTDERIIHYKKILKKVARSCSERERAAEDIERAFDSLYAVRYMSNHTGKTYSGRVSGITEFAYFVEIDIGIEVTIYLPRYHRYIIDSVTGILSTTQGKRVTSIGEKLKIVITGVMGDERRILAEKI